MTFPWQMTITPSLYKFVLVVPKYSVNVLRVNVMVSILAFLKHAFR